MLFIIKLGLTCITIKPHKNNGENLKCYFNAMVSEKVFKSVLFKMYFSNHIKINIR